MSATFAEMRRLVRRMTGNRLDDPRAGDAIQTVLDTLYEYGWSFKKKEAVLSTLAPFATGTVSAGSQPNLLQGTGTAWTAAMVGREIRIALDVGFYKVVAVDVGSQVLTLEAPYAGTLTPNASYVLAQRIYSLAADVDVITSPSYYTRIPEGSQEELDRLDARRSFASTFPCRFIYKGEDANGVLQVEIYPVPSSAIPIRYTYLAKAPQLVQGTDDAVRLAAPREVVAYKAAADGLYSYILEHPELPGIETVMRMAEKYETLGMDKEAKAQYADLKKGSPSQAVHEDDESLTYSDEMAWNHDLG